MAAAPTRPNLLIIVPHDLGDWLGCYGHPSAPTPRLDALAAGGVRFARFFAAAPECTSSRGSLLTGYHPHQNGLVGLSNFGWELSAETPHLAARLRAAGWRTHQFGFQHEQHGDARRLGYETLHAQTEKKAAPVCAAAADWLCTEAARGEGPWFACLGFHETHRPWPEPRDFRAAEMPGLPYLPDLPVVKEELAAFHQSIAGMDAAVGRVLDALAESGQAEETLVLFTADHGAPFPRAKATLYDAGLKVPAVWSWPGRLPAGRTWEGLASNVDVVPTLLDLFGLARPADAPGRSWAPVLRGEDQPGREAVFGSVLYDVTYDPVHCVRTERHKYIRSYAVDPAEAAGIDPDVAPVFRGGRWVRVDDYDVLSSRTWAALEGSAPPPVVEELYDLEADPYEEHNLAPAPAAAATLAGMRRRLEAFRARTGSPLGRAHIPPPPKQREAARKLRPAPLPGGDHG